MKQRKLTQVMKEWWQMELAALRELYRLEEQKLRERLLAGAAWQEVTEERKRVGELLTLIYKKTNPVQFGNPAERSTRQTPDCGDGEQ